MAIAMNVLIGALMVGLTSDLLFHDSIVHSTPNGLSVLLWSITVSLVVTVITAAKKHGVERKCLWWLVPVNLSAFAYMWRDSAILHNIDVYLMFFSLVMLSFSLKGNVAQASGIFDYALASLTTGIDALMEAMALIKVDLPWRQVVPHQVRGKVPALLRGFAFAVPLLLLFCGLFISADAAFASLLNKGLNFNFSDISVHTAILLGFTWCTAGYLRPMFVADRANSNAFMKFGEQSESSEQQSGIPNGTEGEIETAIPKVMLGFGRFELNVVLALLNLLFLSFVMVQFRYFFGGSNVVETTAGLSYAEYARKGFFELATVSALVLPMLLVGDWLLPRHRDKFDKIFPVQSGIQIALLFVIMLSAFQRMNLYQQEYGLTELRFYVSAFIGCMALLYVIFAATVLTGKRSKFAFAASIAALASVAALQFANPDRIIVAANIDNAVKGKAFDADYALSLSNDATAYLAQNIGKLPFPAQKQIAGVLVSQEHHAWHYDVRSFNIARCEAYYAIRNNLPLLNAINTIGAVPDPAAH
ncbi:MAG: DUF4173 domain-containing protein [Cyanobacteria bacterium SZAS-4]|nr:DUF4173 domain-containing protein [Cyanobacteria bacterium SZAS-4]